MAAHAAHGRKGEDFGVLNARASGRVVDVAVDRFVGRGYANGNFGPNDPVTRGQAAKIIVNVFGMTLVNPMTPTFTDVPKDNPFYRFVETLAFHEIVQGREDGQFGVNDKIIRAEIAKVVTLASGHAATSALKDDLEQY